MTELERAKAMIALAELTYMENYYGDNLKLFAQNQTEFSIDATKQYNKSDEGKSV